MIDQNKTKKHEKTRNQVITKAIKVINAPKKTKLKPSKRKKNK